MLKVVAIASFAVMAYLVTVATVMTISFLLPGLVVNAHQGAPAENMLNPETNGDITIQTGLLPDPRPGYLDPHFTFDLSIFQMWFSKENLSQFSVMNLPDEGEWPSFNLRPTYFDFDFNVQIPEQGLNGSTLTFIK